MQRYHIAGDPLEYAPKSWNGEDTFDYTSCFGVQHYDLYRIDGGIPAFQVTALGELTPYMSIESQIIRYSHDALALVS